MGIVQGRSHHFRSEVDRNLTCVYIFLIYMFFKEVSSVHRSCIYLIQNAADAVILWKYFTKSYCFLFEHILKCNSASLLQSSVLHDSSEITSQVTYVTMVPRMGNETLRPLGVATGNALSVTRSEDTYEKTPPVGRRQPMTSLPACHNISAAGRIHHQLLRLKLASEAWSKA